MNPSLHPHNKHDENRLARALLCDRLVSMSDSVSLLASLSPEIVIDDVEGIAR